MATEKEARDVKDRHSAELLRLPGVSGVGVQKSPDGNFYIALHVDSGDSKIADQLPKQLEGVAVQTIASGPFKKLSGGASA